MSFSAFSYPDFLGDFGVQSGIGDLGSLATDFTKNSSLGQPGGNAYSTSTNSPQAGGDLLSSTAAGANATSFTFITAPGQVSYSQGAEIQQVSIFGANNPPLIVTGRNAGELSLGDALMEGFILGKQVKQSIDSLFQMQEVTLDSKNGFVNVPIYTVFAGSEVGSGRSYGNYVIENIEVEEELRDLTGSTTRARVNVSFRQVPAYQISAGIDQATAISGGQAIKSSQTTGQASGQAAQIAANKGNIGAGGIQPGTGIGGGAGGANTGSAATGDTRSRWAQRYQQERRRPAVNG